MKILLLGLSFIAIVSLSSCEKLASQKDSSYNCISGTCEEAEDGDYASYEECKSSCISNSLYYEGNGITDIDGNTYKTVVYGNGQEWMAENLRTSSYRNGDEILYVEDGFDWGNENGFVSTQKVGAWCYQEHDPSNNVLHGKLYNWYAAIDSRGICPSGWHIPTEKEWNEFFEFLGGDHDTVRTKLKSTTGWDETVGNGTNESGFNAFPSGYRRRGVYPHFAHFGNAAHWQTADLYTSNTSKAAHLSTYGPGTMSRHQSQGLSCRCLKD